MELIVKELGTMEYARAWELQKEIFQAVVSAKTDGKESPQTLLLVEHPHVYTLGRNGNINNMLINEHFLKSINAAYFHIDRGGDVTYHGIGQLVGYPIIDMEKVHMGVKEYIHNMEEAIIRTVAEYGIPGERLEGAIGVWIDAGKSTARKICAIGVKTSRFVTMHGFALNVTTDLSYFNHINPCGFTDKGVTSIERETGLTPTLSEVGAKFTRYFKEIFHSD